MTVFKNIEVEVSTKNLGKFKAEIKEARDEVKNLGTNSTKASQETKKSFNVLEQSAAGYGKSIQSADQLREQAAKRAEAALRNEAKLRSELTKGVGGGAAASNMAALYQQSLRAADGYQQQESKLSRLRDTLGGAGRNMDDFKQKTHQSLKTMVAAAGGMDALGTAGVVGTAALVGGMGLATSKMMTFEAVMSEVGAVSNASAAELKQLSEAALKAGQSTIFTATEAAKGQAELAKAGISVKDILGGALKGSLDLAAAGQISVAEAAETAASAMTVFGLKGKDVTHIADLLAGGANAAQGGVHDFALALNQSALVARQFGLDIDETVTGLTLFARSGFLGSDAGTSLKQMFLQLASPSKEASALMKKYGINVYDTTGKFVGFTKTAELLKTQLSGLDEQTRNHALSTIFGADAIRVANLMMREGAGGIKKMGDTLNAQASAAELAAKKMDNLKGDVEQLKGALETALIKTGQSTNGILRTMTSTTTHLVTGMTELPGPVKAAGAAVGGLALATTVAVAVAGTAIPRYRELQTALNGVNIGSMNAGSALGTFTKGLGIATVAMGAGMAIYAAYAASQAKARSEVEGLTTAIIAQRDGTTGAVEKQILKELADSKALETLQKLKVNQRDVNDAILGNADASQRVYDQIVKANPKILEVAGAQDRLKAAPLGSKSAAGDFLQIQISTKNSLDGFNTEKAVREIAKMHGQFSQAASAARDQNKAQSELQESSPAASTALDGLGGAASGAAKGVRELTDQEKELVEAIQAFGSPASAFRDAMTLAQESARDAAQAAADSQRDLQSNQKKALTEQNKAARDALRDRQKADLEALQDRKADLAKNSSAQREAINDEISALKDRQQAELSTFDSQKETYEAGKATVADYASSVTVSLQGYIAQLKKQNDAEEEWMKNLNTIATRFGSDIATQLAKLGPEAAVLVQQFAASTSIEGQKAVEQIRRSLDLTKAGADQATYWRIIEEQSKQGADATAKSIAGALQLRVAEVEGIAAKYGLALKGAAAGVGVLYGPPGINPDGSFKSIESTRRPAGKAFADGGVEDHSAQIAPAGAWRVFAEPETGGEAYIPLAGSKRQRSMAILEQVAVDHFGMDRAAFALAKGARAFASGGILSKIPKPPFLDQKKVVEVMAGKTMDDSYKAVIADAEAILANAAAGPVGSGAVGQGWKAITSLLSSKAIPHTVTSTTGGRHAANSYHYKGKAVDLVSNNMMSIFNSLLSVAGNLSELFYTPAGFSIKNGKRVPPIAAAGHYNHVHAATYDQGGDLKPGWTMAYNGTGQTEHIMTNAQIDRLERAIRESSRASANIRIDGSVSPHETARQVARRFG